MRRTKRLKTLVGQVEKAEKQISTLETQRDRLLAVIDSEVAELRGTPTASRSRSAKTATSTARRPKTGKRKPRNGRRSRDSKKPGITDFIRAKVNRKAIPVSRLATLAKKNGFRMGNIQQVIRLMVGKAPDLKRTADDKIKKTRATTKTRKPVKKKRAGTTKRK